MTDAKKIRVELFTSNLCSRCKQAKQVLSELVVELGEQNFELEFVDVVKHIDRSVEQGVLSTPALVIDKHLVSTTLPRRQELKTLLEDSIGQSS